MRPRLGHAGRGVGRLHQPDLGLGRDLRRPGTTGRPGCRGRSRPSTPRWGGRAGAVRTTTVTVPSLLATACVPLTEHRSSPALWVAMNWFHTTKFQNRHAGGRYVMTSASSSSSTKLPKEYDASRADQPKFASPHLVGLAEVVRQLGDLVPDRVLVVAPHAHGERDDREHRPQPGRAGAEGGGRLFGAVPDRVGFLVCLDLPVDPASCQRVGLVVAGEHDGDARGAARGRT